MANPVEKHFNRALESLDPNCSDANFLGRMTKHMIKIMQDGRKVRYSRLNPVSRQLVETAEDVIGEKLDKLVAVPEPPAIAFEVLETAKKLGISRLELCYLPEIDLLKSENFSDTYREPFAHGIDDDDLELSGHPEYFVVEAMKLGKIKSVVTPGWRLLDTCVQDDKTNKQEYKGDKNFLRPIIKEIRAAGLVPPVYLDLRGTRKDHSWTRIGFKPQEIESLILPKANEKLGLSATDNFFRLPQICEMHLINTLYPEKFRNLFTKQGWHHVDEWCLDKAINPVNDYFIARYFARGDLQIVYGDASVNLSDSRVGFRLIGDFANL